ncbi:zinc finger protein 577 S homeolog [Xenopus laevis]|uniref:MGC81065 protein n=1 Tax=Xenopus laevis TaxID=8355 RepID=Q6INS6_XENLA|nr:zinc finger protein 577 S homeolog [Xenopus laevis]AAH72197.1 MGC81065 protein [Xenopus laevis]
MSRTLPVQMHLTYSDLAVYFSEEEWKDLEGWQKEMYKEVMRDNYENLRSLGIQVPKPDAFFKFQSGKKDVREAIPPDTGSTNEKQVGPKLQPIVLQPQDLITESKAKTSDGKYPKCPKCGDLEDCTCYVYKCNAKKPYICIDCGKSYRKHSLLIVHQRSHFKSQAFKCQCCEKSFLKPSHLQRHMKTHQKYKCPECEECFRNMTLFYKHVKSQHKGRGYRCHTCQEFFQFRSDIVKHRESHKTVHQCGQCKAVYTRLGSLQKHMSHHFPHETNSHGTCRSENGEIQKFSHTTTSHGSSSSENGKTLTFPQTTISHGSNSDNGKSRAVPQTTTRHGSNSENGKSCDVPQTTTRNGSNSENGKSRDVPQTTTRHGSNSENGKSRDVPQTTTRNGSNSENGKSHTVPQTTTSHGSSSLDNGETLMLLHTTISHGTFSSENGEMQRFLRLKGKHRKKRSQRGHLSSHHVHEVQQNKSLKKELVKQKGNKCSSNQAFLNFKTKARIPNISKELPQRPHSRRPQKMKNLNIKQKSTQHKMRNLTAPSVFSPHKLGLIPLIPPTSKNKLWSLKPNAYLEKAELFTCKKCKKRYRHSKSLFRHKKSHTQRFMCHTCGRTFPKLVHVYLHRMVHIVKKRYNCRFCQKLFSVRSLLLLHQKTHKP